MYGNSTDGIGFALLEDENKMTTYILRGIPVHANTGFTFGTTESKELNEFIILGTFTNAEIATVEINGRESEIVKASDFSLWYQISEEDLYNPIVIQAKDHDDKVLFEKSLYSEQKDDVQ